jgi:hypothetical protein
MDGTHRAGLPAGDGRSCGDRLRSSDAHLIRGNDWDGCACRKFKVFLHS